MRLAAWYQLFLFTYLRIEFWKTLNRFWMIPASERQTQRHVFVISNPRYIIIEFLTSPTPFPSLSLLQYLRCPSFTTSKSTSSMSVHRCRRCRQTDVDDVDLEVVSVSIWQSCVAEVRFSSYLCMTKEIQGDLISLLIFLVLQRGKNYLCRATC